MTETTETTKTCFYCEKLDKKGYGGVYLTKKYPLSENNGKYIHKRRCYNKFSANYRYKFNINNYKTERLLRQSNNDYYKLGKKGITSINYSHYNTIGINPKLFYKWLKILSKLYGYNSKLIGTCKYPIDHFIPLRAENILNYDKNKWYNLRPLTRLENKLRKSNMPEDSEIAEYMAYVWEFEDKYL